MSEKIEQIKKLLFEIESLSSTDPATHTYWLKASVAVDNLKNAYEQKIS